jgi:site-specific DNA-methyltransferase (cytosine-N4-specific)
MSSTILNGDVYASLEEIDQSVAAAITSPPYWKQRDYGFTGQIGQEKTPEEYIGRLAVVYDKLRQKLRQDGVFFLNIGDKYLGQYGKSHLLQIPYRLGYHMVKAGWYLEDIIIWYKPNHMPSSVEDRFANTYEPVLVFAKDKNNIYRKGLRNVVKISLQQTPWRHTAVFPEKLVEEMLSRIILKDGDVVLDPFAGTGTVAVVVQKMGSELFPKNISSIMIEKGDEFVKIIQKRVHIQETKKVNDLPYSPMSIVEEELPNLSSNEILEDKHGEVSIAQSSSEFLKTLEGIASEKFMRFHREDALYFFGVKNWRLEDLYYVSQIFPRGYVLRNMLVINENARWYPVFMIARDSTIVAYKFYLDRIRTPPKTEEQRDWSNTDYIGMRVSDISGKNGKEGWITKILRRHEDGFPRLAIVQWDGSASLEMILDPEEDEPVMEGLVFRCPKCTRELEEPFDPAGKNLCPNCGLPLWSKSDMVPIFDEPAEIKGVTAELRNGKLTVGEVIKIEQLKRGRITNSKFAELDRINWGASPGARKTMIGEYFTKMRLYRVDQPTMAQYLTVLRLRKGLSVQNIVEKLPKEYKHTVGHWFRKDFGGSIPIPEDIELLKQVLGTGINLLDILERTALKFQTVMASGKGRNPGDFIECQDKQELASYLRKLYLPPQQYVKLGVETR